MVEEGSAADSELAPLIKSHQVGRAVDVAFGRAFVRDVLQPGGQQLEEGQAPALRPFHDKFRADRGPRRVML